MKLNQKKIEEFCKRNHIASASLFGSVLTSSFNQESDVDFLVKFEQGHIPSLFGIATMESELSEIIGRPAELKTINDLSQYFREEVLSQAQVIYVKPCVENH